MEREKGRCGGMYGVINVGIYFVEGEKEERVSASRENNCQLTSMDLITAILNFPTPPSRLLSSSLPHNNVCCIYGL